MKSKKTGFLILNFILSLLLFSFLKCENKESIGVRPKEFDPTKEVVITDFSPDSGSVRSKLFIYGTNFGTDTTLMSVFVGGVRAPIIGVDGEGIYCQVPARSIEGTIEVKINDGVTEKTAQASRRFMYSARTIVSTLTGHVDSEGRYEIKDGNFEEAGFGAPYWLSLDPNNNNHLFLLE